MTKKVGLYFGTFNPIHIGHMVIANHFAEFSDLDEVWFVVTPHNPFKEKKTLLADYHRYQLVDIATADFPKLKPSRIEFDLPQPNYTSKTLIYLAEKYPDKKFVLIMGEDNLRSFPKWKNSDSIIENYELYVYPRIVNNQKEPELKNHPKVKLVGAPVMEISASFIRKSIKAGKNIEPLLPYKVWKYMDEMNFYR